MCSFEGQLALQDDGTFVEGGGHLPAGSTNYIRNWCTNTGKAALRWDGTFQSGVAGGVMLENVAWNTSALMIKGDQHNVTRNTVFGGADTTPTSAIRDRPKYQDHLSSLDNLSITSAMVGVGRPYDPRADVLTVFSLNIFDRAAIKGNHNPTNATLPGTWRDNLLGYVELGPNDGPNLTQTSASTTSTTSTTRTPAVRAVRTLPTTTAFDIRAELRDPYHHDFRPCPGSQAAQLSAGAYPVWTPNDKEYWIPGRRERVAASTPVPPTGSIGVHLNTDLMFLPARLALLPSSVYFGKAGSALAHLTDLPGAAANVVRLPALLEPRTPYVWRVDTHALSGAVETGAEWTFMTGLVGDISCKITPHPPPQPKPDPPPPAPSGGCAAQFVKDGCAVKFHSQADCYHCVHKHKSDLDAAGCTSGEARKLCPPPSTITAATLPSTLPSNSTTAPYKALGSIDVGTGESTIFNFNGHMYILENIFCGYIDHYGQWDDRFKGKSYARIRNLLTGVAVVNITATIATSFVSAFVDQSRGVVWLSALDEDRCQHQGGTGVLAMSSRDLLTWTRNVAVPGAKTYVSDIAPVDLCSSTHPVVC